MTATIRYMGTKRSLAPRIASVISSRHPNATVVDLFAGVCAVGTALAPRHRIIANDALAFAETTARALLVTPGEVPSPLEALRELKAAFSENWSKLQGTIAERLELEDRALQKVYRPKGWLVLKSLTEKELDAQAPRAIPGLPSIDAYQACPNLEPYSLFSQYYASTYLGIRQAAVVDSLRFAIDQAPVERRDFYLLALLQSVSTCSASPGHLAQFLIPRTERNTKYIARMRRRSILQRFRDSLVSLSLPDCFDRDNNRSLRGDATLFLESRRLSTEKDSLAIYADPPYSRAQYSRYYHVLETLVLYDYPNVTGKGRYREGRFNTDFCRSSKVESAMEALVEAASAIGAPLYLSYPENGLLHHVGGNLEEILQRHYSKVGIVLSVPLAHSTLGGAPGTGAVDVTENVYYAAKAK